MIEYLTLNSARLIEQMSSIIQWLYGFHHLNNLPDTEKDKIANGVGKLAAGEIQRLNLSADLGAKLWKIQAQMSHNTFVSPPAIIRELELFRDEFVVELSKHKFAYIPAPGDKFFEQEALFGQKVFDIFPQARDEIKNAGNCIAAMLDTAAVFHLMRVAELGLRVMARKLRVQPKHKGRPCPLDLGDWEQITVEIKNKITAIRQLPKASKERKAKLELYSDAADHCTFMKDIWRNNMAHCRKPYKSSEAIAALERVRDFMQFLAKAV